MNNIEDELSHAAGAEQHEVESKGGNCDRRGTQYHLGMPLPVCRRKKLAILENSGEVVGLATWRN
jgi:hypothetical protein